MIRYALICELGHDFEGWFGASADFDDQATKGLLACPVCASQAVRKQIMAPALAGTKARGLGGAPGGGTRAMMMDVMSKVRRHVEDNFDYVGDRFAVEARSIHEGAAEERGIYGEASQAEVKALVTDGIQVSPLPPKKSQLN